MLPTNLRVRYLLINYLFLFSVVLFIIWPHEAIAQQGQSVIGTSVVSPQTMLANIAQALPNLMRLVTAVAYVLGMIFIFRGVLELKHVGEMRTMASHEHHLAKPIAYLVVGTLLLYLPTSVQIGMSTFWTNPNPYGYIEQQDQWSQAINICLMVIQFIGTLAFIRGLVILSHAGGGHGGQNTMAQGLTHIIGGILCINIYQFVQVVLNTLGISL